MVFVVYLDPQESGPDLSPNQRTHVHHSLCHDERPRMRIALQ